MVGEGVEAALLVRVQQPLAQRPRDQRSLPHRQREVLPGPHAVSGWSGIRVVPRARNGTANGTSTSSRSTPVFAVPMVVR